MFDEPIRGMERGGNDPSAQAAPPKDALENALDEQRRDWFSGKRTRRRLHNTGTTKPDFGMTEPHSPRVEPVITAALQEPSFFSPATPPTQMHGANVQWRIYCRPVTAALFNPLVRLL